MAAPATPTLPAGGLLDRAIRRITDAWRDMAAGVAPAADESIPAQMHACLAARGGEVSARNRAAKLGEAYLAADEAGRLDFLRHLASFDADPAAIARDLGWRAKWTDLDAVVKSAWEWMRAHPRGYA